MKGKKKTIFLFFISLFFISLFFISLFFISFSLSLFCFQKDYGATPLYVAAQNGHGQIVQLLLEKGKPNINSQRKVLCFFFFFFFFLSFFFILFSFFFFEPWSLSLPSFFFFKQKLVLFFKN